MSHCFAYIEILWHLYSHCCTRLCVLKEILMYWWRIHLLQISSQQELSYPVLFHERSFKNNSRCFKKSLRVPGKVTIAISLMPVHIRPICAFQVGVTAKERSKNEYRHIIGVIYKSVNHIDWILWRVQLINKSQRTILYWGWWLYPAHASPALPSIVSSISSLSCLQL